jgi:hypothetical protein
MQAKEQIMETRKLGATGPQVSAIGLGAMKDSEMNAISNNAHRPVDVDPQLAAIALERLDPLRPLREGLTALGLDHRVAIRPIHTKAGASTGSVSVGISWSLPGDSRAELTWTAAVEPFADDGSLLSSSLQAGANDANGRQRLLAAWPSIGPVFESLTARLFRSVAELADQLADHTEPRHIPRRVAA